MSLKCIKLFKFPNIHANLAARIRFNRWKIPYNVSDGFGTLYGCAGLFSTLAFGNGNPNF
jgi:hypothetical protein